MVSGKILDKTVSISYIEFWDRLHFYGLQSIIILYLTLYFRISDKISCQIYGILAVLPFGLSLIGGIVADKLLGYFYGALLGCTLIIIGNSLLLVQEINLTLLGFSVIALGVGFLKPNSTSLLNTLHSQNPTCISKAYSTLYLWINLGAILGPLLYGLFSQYNFKGCFISSIIGNLSSLFMLLKIKDFLNRPRLSANIIIKIILLLLILALLIFSIFLFEFTIKWIYLFLLISICSIFFCHKNKLVITQSILYKKIGLGFLASIIFFSFFLQMYSSVMLFIQNNIQKKIFNFNIPTNMFCALEPLCIFIVAPILNKFWQQDKYDAELSFSMGLFFASLAFIFLFFSAMCPDAHPSLALLDIFMANLFLATGEVLTIPITISLININSPPALRSTFMGVFYFFITFSGYFSSIIINKAPAMGSSLAEDRKFFMILATLLFSGGISFLLIWFRNRTVLITGYK